MYLIGRNQSEILFLIDNQLNPYNYEKGQFTEIPFIWNDASRTLTIGKRNGFFTGMLNERVFNIVLVTEKNGYGDSHAKTFDATVKYNGDLTSVCFAADNLTTVDVPSDNLTIHVNKNKVSIMSFENQNIKIYDIRGSLIKSIYLTKNIFRTISLPSGIYIAGHKKFVVF